MKKQNFKMLVTVIVLLITLKGNSQSYIVAPPNCFSATMLTTGTVGINVNQTQPSGWFSFTAINTTMFVDLISVDSSFVSVDSVFVYGNNCSSLSLLGVTKNSVPDTLKALEIKVDNLSIGNTYFILVNRNSSLNPNTTNYSLRAYDLTAVSCNLISNGDFESNFGCPGGSTTGCPPPTTALVPNWGMGNYCSADYWNTCAISTNVDPSVYGIPPHSGSGYAGEYGGTHDYFNAPYNAGYEYIRTSFPALVTGDKYYVQMFYARSKSCDWETDGLGMRLQSSSPSVPVSCAVVINPILSPQVQNTSGLISNVNWLPMSGVITGGGENLMIIGNFKPATGTGAYNYLYSPAPSHTVSGVYYFIDDVSTHGQVFSNKKML